MRLDSPGQPVLQNEMSRELKRKGINERKGELREGREGGKEWREGSRIGKGEREGGKKERKTSELLASAFRWKSIHLSFSSELTSPHKATTALEMCQAWSPYPHKYTLDGSFPLVLSRPGYRSPDSKSWEWGVNWE